MRSFLTIAAVLGLQVKNPKALAATRAIDGTF
jgi:hypothetical protein